MSHPAISIIMPVYNGAEFVAEAIGSILSQSFTDFEFIIIDDASTDSTPTILADYARRDGRIRILTNSVNIKIAASLNRGLLVAQAPLVARMDADDWAHPERLEKQYTFMCEHPDVAVCGTRLEVYETGEVWDFPVDDASIRVQSLLYSCVAHPTVMFYKEAVLMLGGYREDMPPAEDYDLWARLMIYGNGRFANLGRVLLRYRVYPEKDRGSYRDKQKHAAEVCRRQLIRALGIDPTVKDMAVHELLYNAHQGADLAMLWDAYRWVHRLLKQNAKLSVYDQRILSDVLYGEWCRAAKAFARRVLRR